MTCSQNFSENQKEDFKKIFKGMKLSFNASERIMGGEDDPYDDNDALICIMCGCSPSCNIDACSACTMCVSGGALQADCFGKPSFGS